MKPSARWMMRVADVLLTLLLTCSTLFLFVETFSLSVSGGVWIVAVFLSVFCPLAAGTRGTARHVLLAAAILTAAIGLLLTAETLPASFRQLFQSISLQYETVYQGSTWTGFWLADHTGAMTLFGLALAGFLGFSLGGKRKHWLPAVLVTVALFAVCIAVTSLPTWDSRLAMLGLLSGWLTLALTGTVRKSDPLRGAVLALCCLPLLAGVSGGVMALTTPDAYTRPAFLETALNAVETRWDDLLINWGLKTAPIETPGSNSDPSPDPRPDTPSIWTDHLAGMNLRDLGPQRYTGQLVLKVRSDTVGRVYLRSYSMGSYVNNQWLDPSLKTNTTSSPLLYPGDLLSAQGDIFPARMDVELVNYGSLAAPVPYYATEVPGGWFSDTYLTWNTNTYSVPYYPYTGDFSEFEISGGSKNAVVRYGEEVREHYTYIQPGLQDQLLALLAEEGIVGGPDVIEQVAEFVKDRAQYNLYAKPLPDGAPDFVMYFLNQSREGYCVHFATAATLLYRALGIPARYVSGFTCDITMANTWTPVADDDAHAWVEVLVYGVGWVPVEVTPGMEPAAPTTTTPPPLSTTSPSTTSREESDPTETTTVTTVTEQPGNEPLKAVNGSVVLAVAIPLLLLAAVLCWRLWQLAQHRRWFAHPDVNRSMIYIWKYARRLARLGGEVPKGVAELAEQAYFSEKGITKAQRDEAAGAVTAALDDAWKTMSFPRRLLAMFVFALK